MEERLRGGKTLILDRYAPSGVAYSSAKGLDLSWCRAPDNGLPKPDLIIFIDVPCETSSGRDGFGEERYEQVEFQKKVRRNFDALMDDTWILVDGAGTVDEVAQRIRLAIQPKIEKDLDAHSPISYLNW